MWRNPVDQLAQRFPGTSALAASTILGAAPSCVVVHAHVLRLVDGYDDTWPHADRLRHAVPGPDADLTVLLHLEPLLRRLVVLLEELTERPRPARRHAARLDAVLTTLETCALPAPRARGRRARLSRPVASPLRRCR
jgi:hypothetical protein